jgi:nucleotide-binding universal stress UspA family protein
MRVVVGWDGSGHALGALEKLTDLFRAGAFDHIEIVLPVWPETDTPRWADIREQQVFSDDLHQAAAQTAADEITRLSAVLRPLAKSVTARSEVGDAVELLLAAVQQSRADMIFIAAGTRDSSGHIESTLERIVASALVPTLILRSPSSHFARTHKTP